MKVKRFSYDQLPGAYYVDSAVNTGLEGVDNISSALVNHETLGKTKGVKRWGRLVNNMSKIIKRKKKNVDNRK